MTPLQEKIFPDREEQFKDLQYSSVKIETILWYTLLEENTSDLEKLRMSVRAEADSPWFSGHFPGDPILPGIAQLEMVAHLVTGSGKHTQNIAGLSRVKFRKIVRPGDQLDVEASPGKISGRYTFRITSKDEEVCSGILLLPSNDT